MSIVCYTKTSRKVELSDQPLAAAGGEGIVHVVIHDVIYTNHCAKIYHPAKRDNTRQKKIEYLIQHKPDNFEADSYLLCWPLDILYNAQKQFIGFIMQKAYDRSEKLYELCPPNIAFKLLPAWEKFQRSTIFGMENRLKVCVNIAIAMHVVHEKQAFVFVDFKPQNILLNPDGKISLIDIDSFQVAGDNSLLYFAGASTPEYSPPESLHLNPSVQYIPHSWDRFSLAVCFYEILIGVHPYAATDSYNTTTISEKINQGLFVHGFNQGRIKVAPPLHQYFLELPTPIRSVFDHSFKLVSGTAQRVSPDEWAKTMMLHINTGALRANSLLPSVTKNKTVNYNKHTANKQHINTNTFNFATPNTNVNAVSPATPIHAAPKKINFWKWTSFVLVIMLGISYCSGGEKKVNLNASASYSSSDRLTITHLKKDGATQNVFDKRLYNNQIIKIRVKNEYPADIHAEGETLTEPLDYPKNSNSNLPDLKQVETSDDPPPVLVNEGVVENSDNIESSTITLIDKPQNLFNYVTLHKKEDIETNSFTPAETKNFTIKIYCTTPLKWANGDNIFCSLYKMKKDRYEGYKRTLIHTNFATLKPYQYEFFANRVISCKSNFALDGFYDTGIYQLEFWYQDCLMYTKEFEVKK